MATKKKGPKEENTGWEVHNHSGDVEYYDTEEEMLDSASEGDEIYNTKRVFVGYAKVTTTITKEKN